MFTTMSWKSAVAKNLSAKMEGAPAAIVKQTAPPFVSVKIAAIHLPKKFKIQLRILIPRKRWRRRRKRVEQVELRKMMKFTDHMHQRVGCS